MRKRRKFQHQTYSTLDHRNHVIKIAPKEYQKSQHGGLRDALKNYFLLFQINDKPPRSQMKFFYFPKPTDVT